MPTSIPVGAYFWQALNLQQQFPVLVWGGDQTNTQVAYLFKKRNQVAADGGGTTVSMAGLTWQTTLGSVNVSASPVVQDDGGAAGSNLSVSFKYMESSDGLGGGLQNDGVLAGATATTTFQTHPGYPDFVQLETDVIDTEANWMAARVVGTRSSAPAGLASSTTVDLTQTLPELSDPAIDTTMPTQPTLSWTSPTMPSAAGTFAQLSWQDTYDGGMRFGSWTVILAPGVTSAQLPLVPPSPLAPGTGAAWPISAQTIVTVQGGGLTSFADLRAAAGATFFQMVYIPTVPLLSADGTILMSVLQHM
jgi:hypothetical protein